MKQSIPFPWLIQVDKALRELNTLPLFGSSPPLDIAHLERDLASYFGASPLSLDINPPVTREENKLYEGLSSDPLILSITLTPLEGEAFWVMSRADLKELVQWVLHGGAHTGGAHTGGAHTGGAHTGGDRAKPLYSEIFQEGLVRYIALHILHTLNTSEPFEPFTLQLHDLKPLDTGHSYHTYDIRARTANHHCWGRLVLSHTLMQSWEHYFQTPKKESHLSSSVKQIEVPVGYKIGSVRLARAKWEEAKVGDFLVLDSALYDVRQKTGQGELVLGSHPLFYVRLKDTSASILDYALNNAPLEADDTFISVAIELAHFRMSVEKLVHLAPGNKLELPLEENLIVSLTVKGQTVGRGELLLLGDVTGVRILDHS